MSYLSVFWLQSVSQSGRIDTSFSMQSTRQQDHKKYTTECFLKTTFLVSKLVRFPLDFLHSLNYFFCFSTNYILESIEANGYLPTSSRVSLIENCKFA